LRFGTFAQATLVLAALAVLPAPAFNDEATHQFLFSITRDEVDLDALRQTIAEGADVNTSRRLIGLPWGPLAQAVAHQDLKAVDILLKAGTDANGRTGASGKEARKRPTPLMFAVYPCFDDAEGSEPVAAYANFAQERPGSRELIRLLVQEHGAELDAADELGRTPLMLAILSGQRDLAWELLSLGARPERTMADGRSAFDLDLRCSDGTAAETYAIQFPERSRELRALLYSYRKEPLFRAELAHRLPVPGGIARIVGDYLYGATGRAAAPAAVGLVESKAAPAAAGLVESKAVPAGSSLADLDCRLLEACAGQDLAAVDALLKAGADVNGRDQKGSTALHQAARNGHLKLLARLLEQKDIEVDRADGDGLSALMHAVSGNQPDCAELLLDTGADPGRRDPQRQSVRERAERHPAVLAVLEQRLEAKVGAEVD
jgi:ankyrin repeat protein